ncbi:MAG: hypothetical protein H7245_07725 [Candidatus Saccharibacteria bacterium]|nr:hypothetical protein [Pseudorhodobacter sp.]
MAKITAAYDDRAKLQAEAVTALARGRAKLATYASALRTVMERIGD